MGCLHTDASFLAAACPVRLAASLWRWLFVTRWLPFDGLLALREVLFVPFVMDCVLFAVDDSL